MTRARALIESVVAGATPAEALKEAGGIKEYELTVYPDDPGGDDRPDYTLHQAFLSDAIKAVGGTPPRRWDDAFDGESFVGVAQVDIDALYAKLPKHRYGKMTWQKGFGRGTKPAEAIIAD